MKKPFSNQIFTNADQEVVEYQGESLSWRVSAYALVMRDDSMLLIKNKNEKLFDIPGGGVEFGETIEEAMRRELMEEAGAKAVIGDLLHLQQGFFKHANGHFYQTIQLFYPGVIVGELVAPTEDVTEFVEFVDFSDLKKYPLPKAVDIAIAKLIRKM